MSCTSDTRQRPLIGSVVRFPLRELREARTRSRDCVPGARRQPAVVMEAGGDWPPGATGVSGPELTRSDAESLYGDVLMAAVANAGDKAKTLAGASGLTLGAVQTVVEGPQGTPPVVFSAGKALDASTPIEPGSQSIEATVTVTYAVS